MSNDKSQNLPKIKTHNTIYFEIIRETSKYNKYIKWFYRSYLEDGRPICSLGYRTQKEAQAFHDRAVETGKKGFPIGDKISHTIYLPKGA